MNQSMFKIISLKQRAMRNLAVSITYREWLGHHCGSLLSLALLLKPMRPQDHCAAVVPPFPPFCSKKDVHDWMIKDAVDRLRTDRIEASIWIVQRAETIAIR